MDTFYVGKRKGIGPVWQLAVVDTATRYAIGALVAGDKSARDAAAFVDHVAERLAGIGVELTGSSAITARSSPLSPQPVLWKPWTREGEMVAKQQEHPPVVAKNGDARPRSRSSTGRRRSAAATSMPHLTPAERAARGKAALAAVPRSGHAGYRGQGHKHGRAGGCQCGEASPH